MLRRPNLGCSHWLEFVYTRMLSRHHCVHSNQPVGECQSRNIIFGDSVELPKWFTSGSGTKKSAKSIFFWLVEGSLSIGCNLGSKCSEC